MSRKCTLRRRERARAAWLIPLSVGAAVAIGVATHGNGGLIALFFLLGLPLLLLAVLLAGMLDTWGPVVIQADRTGLRVGTRFIPREHIRDAVLMPVSEGECHVRVRLQRGSVVQIQTRNTRHGLELLRALGYDAAHATARFRASSLAFPPDTALLAISLSVLPLMALCELTHGRALVEVVAGAASVEALMVAAAMWPSIVEVGADGVLVRWAWRTRFIPAASIEQVSEHAASVDLTLASGRTFNVRVGTGDERTAVATMAERIREAVAARARGTAGSAAAVLARGSRDVRAWIQTLRAVGVGANATLRVAPVDPEELLRLAENPRATAADRAAAAVAFAASGRTDAARRLRVAGEAVAAPALRVALQSAADGNEDALEAALGELSATT